MICQSVKLMLRLTLYAEEIKYKKITDSTNCKSMLKLSSFFVNVEKCKVQLSLFKAITIASKNVNIKINYKPSLSKFKCVLSTPIRLSLKDIGFIGACNI